MIRVLLGLCGDCAEGLASEAAGVRDVEGLCEGCWARLLDAAVLSMATHRPDVARYGEHAGKRCYPVQGIHRSGCLHASEPSVTYRREVTR